MNKKQKHRNNITLRIVEKSGGLKIDLFATKHEQKKQKEQKCACIVCGRNLFTGNWISEINGYLCSPHEKFGCQSMFREIYNFFAQTQLQIILREANMHSKPIKRQQNMYWRVTH